MIYARLGLLLIATLFLSATALAQQGSSIKQSGSVTPGHVMMWTTNGVAQDGGTAALGFLTSVGVVASGPGICQRSALPSTNAWQTFCLGVTTAGGAIISLQNYGTAPAEPLTFVINGTSYEFPYTVGGIVGPGTSIIDHVAVFNNNVGSLLADSGVGFYPGSVTLYVDHIGGVNQVGCGFSASGPGACNTIYYASQQFQTVDKVGPGGEATIQSDCNFTESPPGAFLGPSLTGGAGGGVLFIIGNEVSPGSCTWTSNGIAVDDGAVISLRGFRTATLSSGQTWLSIAKMGLLVYTNMVWGPAIGGAHIGIGDGAVLIAEAGGTYTVGDISCAPTCFNYHVINNGGTFDLSGATVSVPYALTFTAWYSGNNSGSNANLGTNTFTGAGSSTGSTGLPYQVSNNATIPFYGSSTVFPGNGASTIATNACVNGVCTVTIPLFGGATNIASGTTTYCGPVFCGFGAAAAAFTLPSGTSGVVKGLTVNSTASPGVGQSYTIGVYSASGSYYCTILGASATSCTASLGDAVALTAGEGFFIEITTSAGAQTASFGYSVTFSATN